MKTDKALLAGGLALIALVAHFAVPFATFTYEGAETESRTYWPGELAEREAAFDPIAGASMSYALTGILIFAIAMVGFAATRFMTWKWLWQLQAGALGVAVIGAALTIHSRALWLGRGIASWIHGMLGSDGPPPRFLEQGQDYYSSVAIISPTIVLVLCLAAVWLATDFLARQVSRERAPHEQARRFARVAQIAAIAGTLMLVVPWAVETAEDNSPVAEGADPDTDPFMISIYDASRLLADSEAVVERTGEEGLAEYEDIASLNPTVVHFILWPMLFGIVGLVGTRLQVDGQKIIARTTQLLSGWFAIIALGLQAIGTFLVAVFLYEANSRIDAEPAYAPLAAMAVGLVGLLYCMAALRQLGTDRDSLIADKFPEQIIYD